MSYFALSPKFIIMKKNYTLKLYLDSITSFADKTRTKYATSSRYLAAALLMSVGATTNAQINVNYGFDSDLQGWSTLGFGTFNQSTIQACAAGSSARANVFDTTGNSFLSPLLGSATATPVTIAFDYKVVNYAALDQAQASKVEVIGQWSNSATGPWTDFFSINGSNHTPSANCVNKTATFTPTAGPLYIKFQNKALGGSADIFYYYDNIVVSQLGDPVDPCAATNVPYTMPFAAATVPALPECVLMENLNNDNKFWKTAGSTPGIEGKVMQYAYSSTLVANDWFYTRKLNLTAGTSYRLTFKTRASGFEEKLKVSVGSAAAATAMNQTITDITIPATISTAQSQLVDFTVATTGVYNVGFQAHSDPDKNSLYVGEINITTTPTCFAPTNIAISTATIDQTGFTFNWDASVPAPAMGYDYEVRASGLPGSGATGLANSGSTVAGVTTANATGLTAGTLYTIYVRANCGENDKSEWAVSSVVSTSCVATTIPYTIPLASATIPNLPQCVTMQDVNNDGKFWKTNVAQAGITGQVMQYAYSVTLPADDWFYTAPLNLTAGITYRLSYKYKISNFEEKLKVAVGSTASATSMTQILTDVTIPANTSGAVQDVIDFTVATTGVYHVGFQAHSDANKNSLYVGEVSVVAAPTCFPPTGLITTNLDKDAVTIAWTVPSVVPANGYSYEIRTSGAAGSGATGLAASGTTAAGVTTANVSGLAPSTSYSVYVASNCGAEEMSIFTEGVDFTTLCDYLEIVAINDSTCVGSTAVLQVSGATTQVNWFATDSSLEVLATGPLYETPILLETTSYWANASEVLTEQIVQIGEGASTSNSYQNPFYSLWSNIHSQHIILASELSATGLSAGPINSVALTVTNIGTLPMIDLSVKMGTTTAANMSEFVDNANFVTVYNSPSLMPVAGLNVLAFTAPYIWDGTSNIVLEFCHGNAGSSATMSRTVLADATPFVSTIKAHVSSSASSAAACGNTTNQKASFSVRPTFTFSGTIVCEAPSRTEVIATVNEVPVIIGDNVQVISVDALEDATLADLEPMGANVSWFPTQTDAIASTNQLPIATQLNSGTTYYAVLTENGCRSLPFGVLATVELGLANQTMTGLSYFPNPVQNQLNVNYTENITSIVVFNLIGQKVMNVKPNATNVVLDMSTLAAGTYMIQVNSEKASKVIKLIKK